MKRCKIIDMHEFHRPKKTDVLREFTLNWYRVESCLNREIHHVHTTHQFLQKSHFSYTYHVAFGFQVSFFVLISQPTKSSYSYLHPPSCRICRVNNHDFPTQALVKSFNDQTTLSGHDGYDSTIAIEANTQIPIDGSRSLYLVHCITFPKLQRLGGHIFTRFGKVKAILSSIAEHHSWIW